MMKCNENLVNFKNRSFCFTIQLVNLSQLNEMNSHAFPFGNKKLNRENRSKASEVNTILLTC